MSDNPQENKQIGSKLPRLPKIQNSVSALPKLPMVRPAAKKEEAPVMQADSAVQEGEETQAIIAPSADDLARGLEDLKLGGPISSLIDSNSANAQELAEPEANGLGLSGPLGLTGPGGFAQANELSALAEQPEPVMPEPNLPEIDSEASDSSAGPEFGGAALDDSDLMFEDEEGDDAGEKTMMLDAAPDDDLEDDIGGEKTQISMASMDYDPLSGKLIVEAGKTNQREYILVREKTSIGRAPNNDITISDISMSRKHVEIDKFTEGFRLRDLESGNGTVLNGQRIRVAQLRDGDIIEIGSIRFRFEQSGGDPDELWKGDPKVELHPIQKGIKKGAPSPSIACPMPSPSTPAAPSYGGQRPASQVHMPSPKPQPQMESMLERQGGGIAAPPAWATASPMTAPYMTAYGPNALRNVNTPPLWANIVLAALIVICLGSVAWFIVSMFSYKSAEEEVSRRNAIVERINAEFTASLNGYQTRDFEQASKSLQSAQELDKDNDLIKDKAIFDYFKKLYLEEEDLSKQISDIRDKTYSSGKNGLQDIEKDLEFLKEVPADSVCRVLADRAFNRKRDAYSRRLKSDIRELVSKDELSEANNLLVKLSEIPDTESDVKTLRKLISDKKKTMN